jgi:hypothetical protein
VKGPTKRNKQKRRIFDEIVELVVEQRREQSQHHKQRVTCLGDGYQDVLPNEEGNERHMSVSPIAGTCHSGLTAGDLNSKNLLSHLKL